MQFPAGPKFVSVVIPCLDEGEAIGDVVREVWAVGVDEVIVVDNGSTDDTAAKAEAAGARLVRQTERGYGRACAGGLAAVDARSQIVCFLDGDGSDVPSFLPAVVGPIVDGQADFVMGSRLRGRREPGSVTPQQVVAGAIAGRLIRLAYGVRYTDMSPFRAATVEQLRALDMREMTFGWNLEMQMKAAAAACRRCPATSRPACARHGSSRRPSCDCRRPSGTSPRCPDRSAHEDPPHRRRRIHRPARARRAAREEPRRAHRRFASSRRARRPGLAAAARRGVRAGRRARCGRDGPGAGRHRGGDPSRGEGRARRAHRRDPGLRLVERLRDRRGARGDGTREHRAADARELDGRLRRRHRPLRGARPGIARTAPRQRDRPSRN